MLLAGRYLWIQVRVAARSIDDSEETSAASWATSQKIQRWQDRRLRKKRDWDDKEECDGFSKNDSNLAVNKAPCSVQIFSVYKSVKITWTLNMDQKKKIGFRIIHVVESTNRPHKSIDHTRLGRWGPLDGVLIQSMGRSAIAGASSSERSAVTAHAFLLPC